MNKEQIQIPVQREPIRVNRFKVVFPEQFNSLGDVVTFSTRPNWYNGQWDTMQITFQDVIATSTKRNLFDLKEYLQDNICTIQIEDLDPTGLVVSRWSISFNFYHTNFNFGFNDYGNGVIQEISLSFRPINCILNF